MTTRPAPMEGVERINMVIVRGSRQVMEASPRRDPYAIKMDQKRNCYACGGFKHMAHNCRNWRRVAEGRRMEFERTYKHLNNLKEEANLKSLD